MQQKKQKQTFGREKEINMLNEYILFVPNTMDLIVSLCFYEYSIIEKFLRFYTSCVAVFLFICFMLTVLMTPKFLSIHHQRLDWHSQHERSRLVCSASKWGRFHYGILPIASLMLWGYHPSVASTVHRYYHPSWFQGSVSSHQDQVSSILVVRS